MRHMIVKVALLILVLLFSGCAYSPDIPKYSFMQNDKICYLVDLPSGSVLHHNYHFTFTKAPEETVKRYPFDWKMNQFVEGEIISTFKKKYAYDLINLKAHSFTKTDLKNIIIENDNKWEVNSTQLPSYVKLKKIGCKAVILITNGKQRVGVGESIYDKKEKFMQEYGLLTHDDFYILPKPFTEKLYMIDPIADMHILVLNKYEEKTYLEAEMPYVLDFINCSQKKEAGFIKPKDIFNMTEEEMLPFKKILERHFKNRIDSIAEVLQVDDRDSTKAKYSIQNKPLRHLELDCED